MTIYQTRPGVVLTEVCGEYLLVAAKKLLDTCPYVTQINESSAVLWRRLESGATLPELEQAVLDEYEIDDPAQMRASILEFLRQMQEGNYLLEETQP